MASSAELEDLYWQVRRRLLGRHFAMGVAGRANLVSLDNVLPLPQVGSVDAQEEVRRWTVLARMRENPLMWSGRLLTAIAAERALGHPQADRIAVAALDSIGLLYRRRWGSEFDGYVRRWDPDTAESHIEVGGSQLARGFLVNPATGTYLDCVPHSDSRHVPLRSAETLSRLLSDEQRGEYQALLSDQYDTGYRRWEVSMDELWGLVATYAVMHDLIPAPAVRSRVAAQAGMLADYLAGHSYLLVRPAGGLNYRGAAGALPAFEWPFDRVFERVTGRAWPARTDFVGAMERAGYWRLLQAPVDRVATGVTVGALLTSPILAGWLGTATPASLLVGTALGALSVAGAVATPALLQALPSFLGAAPRTLGLYAHQDTFDVDGSEEVAFAHLLLSVRPDLRFAVLMDLLAALPETAVENVRGFLPFAGLSAIADPDPLVRDQYLRQMRIRRAGPDVDRTDLLFGAFASAVAVLNGMGDAEEERLLSILQRRYEQLMANRPEYLSLGRYPPPDDTEDPTREVVDPALDYLVGMSLAWLHARRREELGDRVRTDGFPVPPAPRRGWPSVFVPAAAIAGVPSLAAALGVSPAAGEVDLFDGSVPIDRPAPGSPQLTSSDGFELVDQVTVGVRDVDGDVFTGVTVQPGESVEITATGAITAPEPFARPSDANGWYVVDDARFALHSGLDPVNARKYALLGRLGGYFFVGVHRPAERFLYHRPLPLYLRVNNDDSRVGAGMGAFTVHVQVFGASRLAGEFADDEIPDETGVGSTPPFLVRFRNRGSTWQPSGDVHLILDTVRSDPAWPAQKVPLARSTGPRELASFGAALATPSRPGTYTVAWQLRAGVAALADSPQRQITLVDARCLALSTLISTLPAEIETLQAEMSGAVGQEKANLARKIRGLREQLADARAEFQTRGCT